MPEMRVVTGDGKGGGGLPGAGPNPGAPPGQGMDPARREAAEASDPDADPRLPRLYLAQFDVLLSWCLVLGLIAAAAYGLVAGRTVGATGAAPAHWIGGAMAALAVAGGAIAVGSLIGFLFGLPRTLTSNELRGAQARAEATASAEPAGATPQTAETAPPPQATTSRSSYTDVNTNLEQISDWLTKIIVGIGLTELRTVPERLARFGANTETYFTFGGQFYAIGGGLYFLIAGFYLGYVGTRVRLSLVFTKSQRVNTETAEKWKAQQEAKDKFDVAVNASPSGATTTAPNFAEAAAIAAATQAGTQAPPPPPSDPASVRAADQAVLNLSLTEVSTPQQLRARANALARTGQPHAALDLYRDLMRRSTEYTPDFLFDYAQVLALVGQIPEAQHFAGVAAGLGQTAGSLADVNATLEVAAKRGVALAGLYRNNGKTYRDSIAALDELVALEDQEKDSWIHVWRACAYAQRFEDTPDTTANAAAREADRERVREAIKRAIELDPQQKPYIASLYDPAKTIYGEDDLIPLHPDARIDALLA